MFNILDILQLRILSPGNDVAVDDVADIIIGRVGNDKILPVDPDNVNPGQGRRVVIVGGPGEPIEPLDGQGTTVGPNRDFYLLGDVNNPYFVGGGGLLGTNDFAILVGFQPSEDFIRLNGNPNDYLLIDYELGNLPIGTAIFRREGQLDLISLLPGVAGLSLDSNSFDYATATPEEPELEQVIQLGSTNADASNAITNDSNANPIVTGFTLGDLGGTNAGSGDVYVAKFDNNDNLLWQQQFGTEVEEGGIGAAVDNNDNIFVTGLTAGDLGGQNLGGRDAFIAKLNSNGSLLQTIQFGTPEQDFGLALDVDINNDLLLAGYTTGDLGEPNQGALDVYIAKLDEDLNFLWLNQLGTPEGDEVFGITSDNQGNIFATGWTTGDLGGSNAGLYDGWIAKLDNNGSLLWIEQFGSSDYDFSFDISTDSLGNAYTTGWTLGNLGEETNSGLYDAFLNKYDSDGNLLWTQLLGTSGSDTSFGIDIDSNDIIHIAGYTDDVLGIANAGGDILGADDAYLAKFDTDGNLLEINQFGSSGVDRAIDVNAANTDQIWLTGFTEGSLGDVNAGTADIWVSQVF